MFYISILIIYCWYALSVFPSYSEEVNQSKTWKTLLMHGARSEVYKMISDVLITDTASMTEALHN
jgi:hypothetical protein